MGPRDVTLKGLDDRQANFVALYVELGDAKEAARRSGYAESTAVHAKHRLLASAHVAYAVAVAMRQRIAELAPMALKSLETLARTGESEKVRMEASKAILDRAGFIAPRAVAERKAEEKPLHERTTIELQELAHRLEDEISGRAKPVSSATEAPQAENSVDLVG